MAELNPRTTIFEDPQGFRLSQGFIPNTAAGAAFEGAADLAQAGVEVADTEFTRRATEATEQAVEATNEEFGISQAADMVSAVPVDETLSGTESVPEAITASGPYFEKLTKALRQGNINQLRYSANLNKRVKELKSQYPGYKDVVDQVVANTTGLRPASAFRQELFAALEGANSREATYLGIKESKWSQDAVNLGIDPRGKTIDQLADTVINVNRAQQDMERLNARLGLDKALSDAEIRDARSTVSNSAVTAFRTAFESVQLGPIINRAIEERSSNGVASPETLAEMQQAAAMMEQTMNMERLRFLEGPGGKDERLVKMWDEYNNALFKPLMNSLVNGDVGLLNGNKILTQYKLDAETQALFMTNPAFASIAAMAGAMGSAGTPFINMFLTQPGTVFGDMFTDFSQRMESMNNVAKALSQQTPGSIQWNNMDSTQKNHAGAVFHSLLKTVNEQYTENYFDQNPQALTAYTNALDSLMNADKGVLSPENKVTLAELMANPNTFRILSKIPEERRTPIIQGIMRNEQAAALSNIDTVRDTLDTFAQDMLGVGFDADTMKFVVTGNRERAFLNNSGGLNRTEQAIGMLNRRIDTMGKLAKAQGLDPSEYVKSQMGKLFGVPISKEGITNLGVNQRRTTQAPPAFFSQDTLSFIQKHEGFVAQPYDDAGQLAIGYGNSFPTKKDMVKFVNDTLGTVYNNAEEIRLTREQAAQLMQVKVDEIASYLNSEGINEAYFKSLVSLGYNIGLEALKKSTLLKLLKGGDIPGAADEFLRWNKADGVELPGLTKRRVEERDAFLEGHRTIDQAVADFFTPPTLEEAFARNRGRPWEE